VHGLRDDGCEPENRSVKSLHEKLCARCGGAGERVRVLIAEADDAVARLIRSQLERRMFAADVVANGREALDRLLGETYDIAVIGLGLARLDAVALLQAVRRHGVPVLALVLGTERGDCARALDGGADDYLVKPFDCRELVARVIALSRRALRPPGRELVRRGPLLIDPQAHRATCCGLPLELSATEFRLLLYLCRNPGLTLTRRQMLRHVWNNRCDEPTNVVDVYVGSLRRKLRCAGAGGVITTVYRSGWSLCA
jgi:DNA-binding response OmpR family regulator